MGVILFMNIREVKVATMVNKLIILDNMRARTARNNETSSIIYVTFSLYLPLKKKQCLYVMPCAVASNVKTMIA